MAMDAIPVIFKHLESISTPPEETRIDLFIHSNGGDGIVPWRLVTLIREYCHEFAVLVPHRAFSAATLTALGADEIVMHPMGMLGPTDPTVANKFNPPDPQNPATLLGVSVEDVASYIALVRDDVGIRHEDQLVQAFNLLAEKIHPLALGNVKRATSRSRMLGQQLLRQRKSDERLDEREIEEIIEKLTSKLYFHGHPINREEARRDVRLTFVKNAADEEAAAMWALYEAYARDMKLEEDFQPLQDVYAQTGSPALPAPPLAFPNGQVSGSAPTVVSAALNSLPVVHVESRNAGDVRTTSLEVTVRRDWTGETQANVAMTGGGWEPATT